MLLWNMLYNGWVHDTISRIMQRSTHPVTWHYGYEKAGMTVEDQPAAWNADAIQVDASFIPTAAASRLPADYQLRFPNGMPVPAASFTPREGSPQWRLRFRMPPQKATTNVDLLYRNNPVARTTVPVVGMERFLSELKLEVPSVYALLGEHCVACKRFVASQCRGLQSSAVLSSPHALVPLVDLGLHVELQAKGRSDIQRLEIAFNAAQLLSKQALVTVTPRTWPRKMGTWLVTWHLAGNVVATIQVQAVAQREFLKSLHVVDRKLILYHPDGQVELSSSILPGPSRCRVGPCFIVASSEPGMAGLCDFQLRTSVPGAYRPPLMLSQELLVTDRPTMVAPGTLDPEDVSQISSFELRTRGRDLGSLPLRPLPVANFNAEGAITKLPDLVWDSTAEEALQSALSRLRCNAVK